MTTEEKFRACVNVIRNLPKHGPVQPSHNVMLKFYAYFKQATEGANKTSKPPFWDIVRKAKWDAWAKLGDMDAQVAMQLYVDEFKKIVDTVSKTNANMDKTEIDNFYASVPMNDLELLVGPALARSRSNSPVPDGEINKVENHTGTFENLKLVKANGTGEPVLSAGKKETSVRSMNGCISSSSSIRADDDEEDEYFLDTIENSDTNSMKSRDRPGNTQYSYMNGYAVGSMADERNVDRKVYNDDHETNMHLCKAITSLQKDLEKVVSSVNLIEQRISQVQGKMLSKKADRSFLGLTSTPMTLAILLGWPVLIQLLFYWIRRRHR